MSSFSEIANFIKRLVPADCKHKRPLLFSIQAIKKNVRSQVTSTPNTLLYDFFISRFHTLIFFLFQTCIPKRHRRFVNTLKTNSKMQMCASNYKKTSQIVPQLSPFCMFIMKKVNKILLLIVGI